jgi:tetratricopeptide (TPR) repeat protein
MSAVGRLLRVFARLDEAMESYRDAVALAAQLVAADPGNAERQHDLWAAYYALGRLQVDVKRAEDARTSYAAAATILETLANAHPEIVSWQTELVATLAALATLGDDAVGVYRRALAILRRLEADGKLPADSKGWIAILEGNIASLQN